MPEALVGERPDVIVTQGGAVRAMVPIAANLPIVFGYSGDPVSAGLTKSLALPGGNMTGISFMTLELVGKRMELLKEALPRLKSVAILANPEHAGEPLERRAAQSSAAALGLEHAYFQAHTADELGVAMAAIAKTGVEALVVFPDALTLGHRQQLAEAALKARVAATSGWAQFAESGFLVTHGPNLKESHRRLATFVDKILKGAKPADLPIERPSVVETVVNLRSARTLGLAIPQSILLRADQVVD